MIEVVDRGVSCPSDVVRVSVRPGLKSVLTKPHNRKPSVGVEVTFLLDQDLIENFVDPGQRRSHWHR